MFDIAHVDLTPATTQEALHVQAAAAALDRLKPGWANLVNLDTLCLESHRCCVLGQVFAQEAAAGSGPFPYPMSGYGYGYQILAAQFRIGFPFNSDVFAHDRVYKHHWINAIRQRTTTPVVAAVA